MSSIIAQARQWLAEREPGRWEAYDDCGIVSLRDADRDAPLATDLSPEDRHMFEALPDMARELLRMEAERDELARELQTEPGVQPAVTGGMPESTRRAIAAWRALPAGEREARLRRCVVDEVVGNMVMEGQPPSPEWIRRATEESEHE